MQKTEKHCKNPCFCYHKTTKISPKTGPKTQKSASGPGHLRNRKKRCCKPKNWGQKVEKHEFFSLFACRFFGRARSRTGVFRTVFYSVFWRRASRPIKNRRFWPKNAPPPPGKPVTFYECHPDDHAPAPSVRADFEVDGASTLLRWYILISGGSGVPGDVRKKWEKMSGDLMIFAWPIRIHPLKSEFSCGVTVHSQYFPLNHHEVIVFSYFYW